LYRLRHSLFACAFLFLALASSPAPAYGQLAPGQLFADVPPSHPFFIQINIFGNLGITNGCSTNPPLFCPDAPVTRGQIAVFLIRSLMTDNFPYPQTPYFADVPPSHPFFRYIQKITQLGITEGCSGTSDVIARFCPDDLVTRGTMAVYVIRAKLATPAFGPTFTFPTTPYFTDVPATSILFPFVQKMRDLRITSGCTTTRYCPDLAITRGQIAVFLVRGFFT
jgi:hypothetical protein